MAANIAPMRLLQGAQQEDHKGPQNKSAGAGADGAKGTGSRLSPADFQDIAAKAYGKKLPKFKPAHVDLQGSFLGISCGDGDSQILAKTWKVFLSCINLHPCVSLLILGTAYRLAVVCKPVASIKSPELVCASVIWLSTEWELEEADLPDSLQTKFLAKLGIRRKGWEIKNTISLCIMELTSP